MAGDDQGRFYVADTGNNRVARFTSGGQLDTTIAGPVDAGFQSPSSLGLGYVGTKGGVEPVLFVLDAGGRLTACRIGLETLCVPITTQTMDGFVIPPGWLAGETCDGLDAPTHVWARAGQVLYRVGTGSRIALPPVNGLRDFTGSFDQLTPYWAAIDGKGQLLEWASTPSNTRRSSLPTQASALALDEGASAYLHDRDVGEGAAVGPLVLYVGSPGTIERRVAPALEVIR